MKKLFIILMLVTALVGGYSLGRHSRSHDYEQGHYDALREARDTYGLEVEFSEYSDFIKK